MTDPSEAAKAKAAALINKQIRNSQFAIWEADHIQGGLNNVAFAFAAFIQQVSDAVNEIGDWLDGTPHKDALKSFILPEPVDPLTRVLSMTSSQVDRNTFAERLAKEGLKIVKDNTS